MEGLDLESIPVFASLSASDRARVASVARLLHWDTGHVALREGEFAFDLYAIKQGAAEVRNEVNALLRSDRATVSANSGSASPRAADGQDAGRRRWW
jgi:hypothetical protein